VIQLSGRTRVQRIMIIDAPSVLGVEALARYGVSGTRWGCLRASSGAAADAGLLEAGAVDVMAHVGWTDAERDRALRRPRPRTARPAMMTARRRYDKLLGASRQTAT